MKRFQFLILFFLFLFTSTKIFAQTCIDPATLQNNTLEVCYGETVTFCPDVGDNCPKWQPSTVFPTEEETTYNQPTTIEITEDVVITLIETKDGNIENETTINIVVADEIIVDLPLQIEICDGGTALIEPIITGGSGNYSYIWNTGETTASISVSPTELATYEVIVEDLNNGCSTANSVDVIIRELPEAYITSDFLSVCQSNILLLTAPNPPSNPVDPCDSPGSPIEIQANIDESTPGGIYTYEWSAPYDQLTTSSIFVNEAGTFSVTVTDVLGCTTMASYEISSCAQVSIEKSVQANNGVIEYLLTAEGSTSGYTFEWSDGISSSNSITVSQSGIYSVKATSPEGCEVIESIEIKYPCSMPDEGYVHTPDNVGLLLLEDTPLLFDEANGQTLGFSVGGVDYFQDFNSQGEFEGYGYDSQVPVLENITIFQGLMEKTSSGECVCSITQSWTEDPQQNSVSVFGTPDGTDNSLLPGASTPELIFPPLSVITQYPNQPAPAEFCITPHPQNGFDNDDLVDIILSDAASNDITESNLNTLLNQIPAYLQMNEYNAAYYLYNKQDGSLKIYPKGGSVINVPQNDIKSKLEELQNNSFSSDLNYVAFFELDNSNAENLRFEFITKQGAWQPKEGVWLKHPEFEYRAIVEGGFKDWFAGLDNINDPTYENDPQPTALDYDGKLETFETRFFKALAAAADLAHHAVTEAEMKRTFWDAGETQYVNKPFHVPVPIAGVFDQGVVEVRELKELVSAVIEVGKKPKETLVSLYEGIKQLDPLEIPVAILNEFIDQWNVITSNSQEGTYQRSRAATQAGGEVFKASVGGFGGGALILAFLEKVVKTVKFLRKFTNVNLKNKLKNLTSDKANQFLDDFENPSQEFINEFNQNENLVDSWDALLSSSELRKNINNLNDVDDYVTKNPGTINSIKSNFDDLPESRKQSYLKGIKNGAQNPLNINNARRATPDEISSSVNKLADHRNSVNNPSSGNYGYIEGNVGNNIPDGVPVRSGPPDTDIPEIFTAIPVNNQNIPGGPGAWVRTTDSEYKMLNRLAHSLGAEAGNTYPNFSGTLKIVSERTYCPSCAGVIQDFNTMFPNVDLILVDGIK